MSGGTSRGWAPGGRFAVSLGALTHVGRQRGNNQDAFCALAGAQAPPGVEAFLAVADGLGGHQAGEVASAMAIERLARRLSTGRKGSGVQDGPPLKREVEEINAEIYQAAMKPALRGMGTTLTAAVLAGANLYLAHVGDSRAYLLRDGHLRQLTQDHSWVAEQVAAGLLTPEEAQSHPRRSVLIRALGTSPAVEVDTLTIQVQERDVLLLCSDGLHSVLADEALARVLAREQPQTACEALVAEANAQGGPDNITTVVLRIAPPVRQGVPQGAEGAASSLPDGAPGRALWPASLPRALARLSRALSRKRS